jgi:hypothetical protein
MVLGNLVKIVNASSNFVSLCLRGKDELHRIAMA